MSKRVYKELPIVKKVELLKEAGSKSVRRLAKDYGVSVGTVSNMLKRKREIEEQYESNVGAERCRKLRKTSHDELNNLMWDFFQTCRRKNIPMSGPMLQEQARAYSVQMGDVDFKASNGWLESFKKRHNISSKEICGEAADVSEQTVMDWKEKLPSLCVGYASKDIFNADETGLFFRGLPSKSLVARGDDCKGGKHSKERITVMFGASVTGENLKPLVIGRALKPRCFQGVDTARLPAYWFANKKAWMTSVLFQDWLKILNRQMRSQNRKILLFMDNAPSHPDVKLSNVLVKIFPANTTSKLQPMDQGVIKAVKTRYKKLLLTSLLQKLEDCETVTELVKKVTVLDAVNWVCKAWNDLPPTTIQKYFRRSGFELERSAEVEDDDDDNVPLAELAELMKLATPKLGLDSETTVEEFVSADSSLPTTTERNGNWKERLLEEVNKSAESTDEEEEEDVTESETEPEISSRDASEMIRRLQMYALRKAPGLLEAVTKLETDHNEIRVKKLSHPAQRTLDSFFTPCGSQITTD